MTLRRSSFLLLLAACSLPTMQVKPDLAPQLPFERPTFDTGSSVRFGGYRVAAVDRTAFEGSSSSTESALPAWLKSIGEFSNHRITRSTCRTRAARSRACVAAPRRAAAGPTSKARAW